MLYTVRVNNQLDTLFYLFISLLYMFRATQCSSSGESIVSIYHLVYITCVGGRLLCRSDLPTRQPPTKSDI